MTTFAYQDSSGESKRSKRGLRKHELELGRLVVVDVQEERLCKGPVGYEEVGCPTLTFCDAKGCENRNPVSFRSQPARTVNLREP